MDSFIDDIDDLINKVNNNNDDDSSQTEAEVKETYTDTNQPRSELELELTPELKQAGIVNRFAYYTKTNAILVLLNHHYNSKSIVFSVYKKDWNKTHSIFEKQLKQKGIDKKHIPLLLDILDQNYQAILSLGALDPQSAESDSSDEK